MSYRNNEEQKSLLNQFLAGYKVELPAAVLDRLYSFADLVVNTKEYGNLISEKDSQKFLSRHIADSLMPYIYIGKLLGESNTQQGDSGSKTGMTDYPKTQIVDCSEASITEHVGSLPFSISKRSALPSLKWADMGAGAGCPVFPLAIVMPEVQFYAVEPRHMRVNFMQMVKEKLHLDNLTVVGKRFETSGLSDLDVISCRALSTFENDWERAKSGLKKNGVFATLKSFNNIVHLENDPAVHIYKYALPLEEQEYALVTRGNE